MFNTSYEREHGLGEINDGTKHTETAGYVSAEEQISTLMRAGRNLQDFRKLKYDFPEAKNVDMRICDPSRGPNFDMADASEIQAITNQKIANAKRALAKAEKEAKNDEELNKRNEDHVPSSTEDN